MCSCRRDAVFDRDCVLKSSFLTSGGTKALCRGRSIVQSALWPAMFPVLHVLGKTVFWWCLQQVPDVDRRAGIWSRALMRNRVIVVDMVDSFFQRACMDVTRSAQKSQFPDDGHTRWTCVYIELKQLRRRVHECYPAGRRGGFTGAWWESQRVYQQ